VLVGIEAIGPMRWFLDLLRELGIKCQVGDAAKIRAAEPHKQKHDRRDAELILKLLVENRFPAVWMPSPNCSICAPCYCTGTTGCACEGYHG
jgi:transposase